MYHLRIIELTVVSKVYTNMFSESYGWCMGRMKKSYLIYFE